MKEAVAIAKEADAKKEFSPTSKSIHRVLNEPERQLGSLRGVINNIRSDGGTPSVDSIATELSSVPSAQRASVLLALQRTHGNRYAQRVVTGIQAKLKVGQPGDKYEREADRIANQVMRMPEPHVWRQSEDEERKKKKEVMAKGALRKAPEVSDNLQARLNQSKGGGHPLPEETRTFMESRFGVDFSTVRVHTDSHAAQMARDLNAEAFTYERDIYFGADRYSPQASSGNRLLAHELTHVVQQGATSKLRLNLPGAIQRQEAAEGERSEPATAAARAAAPAGAAPAQAAASTLTRFTGRNFTGATVIADREFVDSLEAIDRHAGNNNVQVYVTDSFRRAGRAVRGAIVTPATRSNHLAGHAIDMNVRSGGRLYNSTALSNFESLPENVQNFINAIRNDSGLRWGGDFSTPDPVHIDDNLNSDDAEWQERYNTTQASPNP